MTTTNESRAFRDRLLGTDEKFLGVILNYVAEEDCAEGFEDLNAGDCGCVICMARRLISRLWPTPRLTSKDVAELLDVIDDARQLYTPVELTTAGFPARVVKAATREYHGQSAVVGLALIEALAEDSGINQELLPKYVGWQRTMRCLKAAIRREWDLPPVAGEED